MLLPFAAFRRIGFFPETNDPCGYVDLVGSISQGFNQEVPTMMAGWAEEAMALVDGERLTVLIPWRP